MADQEKKRPKHPEVQVRLSGQDGNVYSIIRRVSKAMQRAGVDTAERGAFAAEVMGSSSYEDAITIVSSWVEVY